MSTDLLSKTATPIKALPTIERLRELLAYDPAAGVFRWKVGRRGTARAGSVAGAITNLGYRQIRIDGVDYLAHRLAWKITTGKDPVKEIDHINNRRDDNRIANLRPATRVQQSRNVTAWGSSKYLGVCWDKANAKWQVHIVVDGKARKLGRFTDEIEAARAYDAAAAKHHGEFSNPNFPVDS